MEVKESKLVGIALKTKTTNENGQSAVDCGNLWQTFEKENYGSRIKDKLSEDVFAVYYNYDGDHTLPFFYFIGCKVPADAAVPEGMDSINIQEGNYQKFTAKGKMTGCITDKWKEIWSEPISRAYKTDFEVYNDKSSNWNDAEVDIFISVT